MKNTSTKQEEQFTIIPYSLMSNKDLTDQDKLTLGIILSFIKNGKECYIGNDTLGEMLGITKNAASIRILRLEKISCISLRYTYKPNTKYVDKRYITLLSLTPKVSSDGQQVSSHRRRDIVSQTKRSRPTDEEISSKDGGIIQPDYTSVLDKELDNLPHKLLHKENPVEKLNQFEVTELIKIIKSKRIPESVEDYFISFIKNEDITRKNKSQILKYENTYQNTGTKITEIFNYLKQI